MDLQWTFWVTSKHHICSHPATASPPTAHPRHLSHINFTSQKPIMVMPPHRHLPFLRQSWVEQQYPARRPQYPPSDESIPRAIFQASHCSNDTSLRTQHMPTMPEQVVLSHAKFAGHVLTYRPPFAPPPHRPQLLQILIFWVSIIPPIHEESSWVLICLVTWEYTHLPQRPLILIL